MTTLLCLIYLYLVVQRTNSEECVGCITKFINDPMGCEYWASLHKDGCDKWSNEQTVTDRNNNDPVMHTPLARHCVYMAAYSIAENKGKLKLWTTHRVPAGQRRTQWTKILWNRRGRDIDDIFKAPHVRAEWASLRNHGWKDMSREYHPFRRHASFGGGEFHPLLEQLMFENVGLNFALNQKVDDESAQYPDYWTRSFVADFKFLRGENWKGQSRDINWYKSVLRGDEIFKNRANEEKPMVGIIIGVNTLPFAQKYNHDTAFLKHTNGHFYYLDSNVPIIRTLLPSNENPPMTNLYHDEPISFDMQNPTEGYENGYLVDWSLDLGSDVDIAAQWLYDKCEVRPTHLDRSNPPTMDMAHSGGAMFFRIVVEGESRKWNDLLKEYKQKTKKEETRIGKKNPPEETAVGNGGKIRNFVSGLNPRVQRGGSDAEIVDFPIDWLRNEEKASHGFVREQINHRIGNIASDKDMYFWLFIGLGICFEAFVMMCFVSIVILVLSIYFGYKYKNKQHVVIGMENNII